jgi:signal transduction histidine kinase
MRISNPRSVMIVPLTTQGQSIGAITFVSSSLTKQYTEADLAMAEELASRASLAIANAHLYTEAQNAIGIRDDFISIASHELKTPLTSLKMYTQVLHKQLARKGEKSLTAYLAKMDAQLNKLTALIGDLLNVSKIELGQLPFQDEMFDVNEVVKETVEQMQLTTTKHTIRIEGMIPQPVWGDKDRIGQVLTNLLSNALKYSPDADTVLVRLTPEQDVAVVTVQDFGIGIAKEHQSKIFTRFYRVNDPKEKTYPGLGIGLYIANEIIKRHGGTMTVISEKGKGSQFSFTLPYTRSTLKTS